MSDWEDAPSAGGWEDAPTNDKLVRQIPGMENSLPSDRNVGKDDSSMLDKARGVAEAAAYTAAGIPATLAEAYGQKLFNTEPGKVSEQFYQPRTEKGKEYSEHVGEFANRYLNPLMGGVGAARFPHEAIENVRTKGKTATDTDRVIAKQAELDAQKVKTAGDALWEDAPVQSQVADPFAQMKSQLKTPQTNEGPFIDPALLRERNQGPAAFNEMGKQLEATPERHAAEALVEKQTETQRALEERQAQQDFEVKRQATLDFNAAERARQDNAGIPDRAPEDPMAADIYNDLQGAAMRDKTANGVPDAFPEPNSKFPPRDPFKGPGRKQAGAINPEVFVDGFEKLKQLADGTWLRAFSEHGDLKIEASKDSRILGTTSMRPEYMDRNRSDEQSASPWMTQVHPEARSKGIASEMYKFASELGNDVSKSSSQTQSGRALWDGLEQKGIAKDGLIPHAESNKPFGNLDSPMRRKQTGAIRIGERTQKQLEKVIGKQDNFIPKDPDPKAILQEAQAEGRDSNASTYAESGSTLAAMKRRSSLVLGVSRLVQNADKRSDLAIKQNVFPAEKAIRDLSTKEMATFVDLLKKEAERSSRFDAESLSLLPVKQQVAYAHFRAMMEDTLRIQNEKRVADGKEPIAALEAYTSHRWEGDFRRPVFETRLDRNGNPKIKDDGTLERKLVWYLADHTKRGLEKQWETLSKKHPDLAYDPKEDHTVRFYKRQTDLQSAYTTMLDIIGRDDPAVAKLKEAVEAQTANEAASFLAQEKHFKEQTGVRGYVGDRPGRKGSSESLAFLQQQINYAKNAYKWSEMQTAGNSVKELISDPQLKQEQPNNIEYAKEYFKNAVGHGEALAITHLQDAIRNLGVNVHALDKGVSGMKSFFVLQKLATNLGYSAVSMLQSANVLPHLMDQWLSKRTAGNPITAMSVGIAAGMAMASGHYVPFLKSMGSSIADSNFYKQAFKYAEDNGVSARSLYDEAPIDSSFTNTGRVGHLLGLTMTIPEVASRSIAYMSFVQALREGGKLNGNELFQKAEELTNAAMVDYRSQERPLAFSKLGPVGNALNVFQTFPINWYNQLNYFARESARGNVAPMATFLMLQYALGGASSLPGFDDADKLYGFVRDHLPAAEYAKLKESNFWSDPKLWMLENFGDSSVYGALSDKSGVGFTSRVSAPGAGQMVQAPGGPILDLFKQAYNAVDALTSVDNKTKWVQSAMSSAPSGLQGALEQAPFMEGSTFEKNPRTGNRIYQRPGDIADHKGVYERTPRDETLRKYGLRSQEEVVNREVGYRIDRANRISAEKAKTIPDAVYDAVKRGDIDKAKDLSLAYTKLTGEAFNWDTLAQQGQDNYTTAIQRSQSAAKTTSQLLNVARMQKIIDTIKKEQAK